MSLKIRLARGGSKKNAHYRVVVLESTKTRDGRAIDIIGHYHPTIHNENRFIIDAEKLNKWLSNGALPTEAIARLCIANGMENMKKYLPVHGESKNKGVKKKDQKQNNG